MMTARTNDPRPVAQLRPQTTTDNAAAIAALADHMRNMRRDLLRAIVIMGAINLGGAACLAFLH